jgi:hypothetical protein
MRHPARNMPVYPKPDPIDTLGFYFTYPDLSSQSSSHQALSSTTLLSPWTPVSTSPTHFAAPPERYFPSHKSVAIFGLCVSPDQKIGTLRWR